MSWVFLPLDILIEWLRLPADSLIKAMSGGGTGRGSGRAHFRSRLGCCICGTKSSSSRFTASERYAEHFGPCFGEVASRRSGDLCNACVLCVKRWIQRGRQPGYFSQVRVVSNQVHSFQSFLFLQLIKVVLFLEKSRCMFILYFAFGVSLP